METTIITKELIRNITDPSQAVAANKFDGDVALPLRAMDDMQSFGGSGIRISCS